MSTTHLQFPVHIDMHVTGVNDQSEAVKRASGKADWWSSRMWGIRFRLYEWLYKGVRNLWRFISFNKSSFWTVVNITVSYSGIINGAAARSRTPSVHSLQTADILTGRSCISMHFTRRGTFRFAPGTSLSQMETLANVGQELIDDADFVLRRRASTDWQKTHFY